MLVVDLVITWHCLVKEAPVVENLLKAQFHIKTGFIFFILLSHSFTETDSKKGQVLWQLFLKG